VSATFVDRAIVRAAARFGLTGEQLFDAPSMLANYDATALDDQSDDLNHIADLRDRLLDAIGQFEGKASAKAQRSIAYHAAKVIAHQREQRLAKRGLGKGNLGQIVAAIRPQGKPQERVTNVLELVAKYGWTFVDRAIDAIDPTQPAHQLVEVDATED
jgi:hypothetical protein